MSGFIFILNGGAICWKSSKQNTVADSVCEAEYVAACTASKDIVWLRLFFSEISLHQSVPSPLFIDNAGTIVLTKDNSFHQRSKHIDVQYHYICKLVDRKVLATAHISSEHNLADIFTKPLPPQELGLPAS